MPDINQVNKSIQDTIACYKKNKSRIKFDFCIYCLLPFIGFFYDIAIGLLMLIFLSPIWCIFLWGSLKRLKQADHETTTTRQYIKVDNFSSKGIPWVDIKAFRLVNLSITKHRNFILVAEFFKNSKY